MLGTGCNLPPLLPSLKHRKNGNFPARWINESPVGNHFRNTPWEHRRNGFPSLAAASQPIQEALLLWGPCSCSGWQRAQGINHRVEVGQETLFLIRLLLLWLVKTLKVKGIKMTRSVKYYIVSAGNTLFSLEPTEQYSSSLKSTRCPSLCTKVFGR